MADFIEDYGVDTIYVLGGSAAVADSVLEDLEALANEPTVTRIEGADRYATAAAIAAKLGGGAAWCGGEDAAAILVNGGDVSLAEAMMVGPIAHRLQLPVLLTAADELPSATTDFIEAEDIEHVVIVGGTDSVSEDVADAVSDAGVDTVERIAGDTAAGTSVALAGLLTGDCKDDLAPVSDDMVALVNRDALPDGVAAAPVLSSSSDLAERRPGPDPGGRRHAPRVGARLPRCHASGERQRRQAGTEDRRDRRHRRRQRQRHGRCSRGRGFG